MANRFQALDVFGSWVYSVSPMGYLSLFDIVDQVSGSLMNTYQLCLNHDILTFITLWSTDKEGILAKKMEELAYEATDKVYGKEDTGPYESLRYVTNFLI